jgi:stage II sporulation protein R
MLTKKQKRTGGLHNAPHWFRKRSPKKKWGILLPGLLLVLAAVFFFPGEKKASADSLQQGIAEKILRFHVIANSDSPEDQALKLEIKDAVLNYMQPILADAKTAEDTRRLFLAHSEEIRQLAQEYIDRYGYNYCAAVYLDTRYFPVKTYGNYTFPAGEYEAVCVELGNHAGKNWWCVLYPSLCFVDAVHATVPEDSDAQLRQLLTEEEYDAITQGKGKVTFTFRFLDWF